MVKINTETVLSQIIPYTNESLDNYYQFAENFKNCVCVFIRQYVAHKVFNNENKISFCVRHIAVGKEVSSAFAMHVPTARRSVYIHLLLALD